MRSLSWMISINIGISSAGGSCFGQAIQLPSYRIFQIPLQAVVPDGGTSVVGGISQAAGYRSARGYGWLPHRAIGSSRSASSIQVSAQIIDHEEFDKAILNQAQQGGGDTSLERERSESFLQLKRQVQNPSRQIELQQRQLASSTERTRLGTEEEGRQLLQQGDRNYTERRVGTPRIFYRIAWKKSRGPLREAAAQRLQTIANLSPQQPPSPEARP